MWTLGGRNPENTTDENDERHQRCLLPHTQRAAVCHLLFTLLLYIVANLMDSDWPRTDSLLNVS